MKTAIAELESISPISFSRRYDEIDDSPDAQRREGEKVADHEKRTWRYKCHYDEQTREVIIPGVQFKMALDWTARQLGLKIGGRGLKTWATMFQSGVICIEPLGLGVKMDEVKCVRFYCNSQGRRGGKLDVMRHFPIVDSWKGTVTFTIIDDTITEDIFALHLQRAGEVCGLGRYAPRNGGFLGRFAVKEVLWQDEAVPLGKAA